MTDEFYKQATLPGGGVKEREMPEKIGPYVVEGRLDKGGMSELFLAVDPETHEPRVIKVLAEKFVTHPEMKERFLKEAEIIEIANHPNIVRLYGHGEWEGGLYIAMEFIQGISLRQFITQQTMSLGRAVDLVLHVGAALAHLHGHGIIHRDLKPENVVITGDGGVKVIDFGIAQLGPEIGQSVMMGTPAYMSPEQKKDPLQVAPNTDIYSLGIILYELVLGRPSHGAVSLRLMPKSLQPVLAKALEPDPTKRYQVVGEFEGDLGEIKVDEGKAYAKDLSEHLREAQASILPEAPPQWHHVSLGLASHNDLSVSGLYYDFMKVNGSYAIILSEPSSMGVDGVVHSAMLQGMFHALADRPMEEVVKEINRMLVEHPLEQIFTLNYLVLNPQENELHYLSCGHGPLWMIRAGTDHPEVIHSENIALGIEGGMEFLSVKQGWHVGDAVVLGTLHASGDEHPFRDTLQEVLYTSAQGQADAILRRMAYQEDGPKGRRPMTVISVHRNF